MSEAIREAAHAEVENKIQAGIRLEDAVQQSQAATEAATAARKHAAEARKAALAAGWTETQLRNLGLAERRRRRPAQGVSTEN